MAASTAVLLDVKGASRSFGGLKALSEVSFILTRGAHRPDRTERCRQNNIVQPANRGVPALYR